MKRVSNWANTIYTVKKNQEDFRFKKFMVDEIERIKIDEEEKIFQEEQRKQ